MPHPAPEHPPLTSLRSFAPPYACAKGAEIPRSARNDKVSTRQPNFASCGDINGEGLAKVALFQPWSLSSMRSVS